MAMIKSNIFPVTESRGRGIGAWYAIFVCIVAKEWKFAFKVLTSAPPCTSFIVLDKLSVFPKPKFVYIYKDS